VARRADAEDLHIDAARFANLLFIGGTIPLDGGLDGPLRNLNVAEIDIDVIEELPLHVGMIALRMVG
jgi:hypothetical protein